MSFLLGNLLPPRGRTELVVLGTGLLRGRDPDRVEPEESFAGVNPDRLPAVAGEPDHDGHLVAPVVAVTADPAVAGLVAEAVEEGALRPVEALERRRRSLGHDALGDLQDHRVVA